ncbi:hypothetical protein ncot_18360 [Nocardioides sp. JQ2195]|uniref:hypothetical protein n=1 Tax=Nocardioides sp. JQ2195 TaxID=2592334 RepID=UPI00143E242D|nr:hypothetical protein [Nocardioides sp. JQ2195]QIX28333.1 hypothetical protein ncot_18360 [Nocardioides sp. JQ2195]
MRMRRMLTGVAVMLALAGCGNDSAQTLDDDEQQAAQALSVEFRGEDPSDFERDVGVCMGKHLVNDLGTDRLVAGGMLHDDLTVRKSRSGVKDEQVAEAYAEAVLACRDVRGEVESRRDRYPKATDADVDDYVTCVEDIDKALLKNAVVASAMHSPDPATRTYAAKTRRCAEVLGQPGRK